jgi:hypothetical protein
MRGPFAPDRIEDIPTLLGAVGCAYVKKGRYPPFRLREFAERWARSGIPLDECFRWARANHVSDAELPWLDQLIRSNWSAKAKPPKEEKPKETRRLFRRELVDKRNQPAVVTPVDAAPVKPLDKAIAFLLGELAGGTEVATITLEADAERAGIALRTLDRARGRLKVHSRRTGFGKNSRFYLSLSSPLSANKMHRAPTKS